MERFTISLPASLAASFDQWIEKRGYTTRSEAVRDLVRGTLDADQAADGPAALSIGSLTYLYDYNGLTASTRLAHAHHDHHPLVVATVQAHLDQERCLEVSILRGPGAALSALANSITTLRGVRHGHLHLICGDTPMRPLQSPPESLANAALYARNATCDQLTTSSTPPNCHAADPGR
jgi:CopG family nickel-responsive transcriptional regulator